MGFLGLFTPKWRHRDAKVRLAAVQRLQAHDDGILVKVALGDSDPAVRMAAAARIVSESTLRRLLVATDPRVVAMARERLSGVAARLVKEASALSQCADLLAGISEQSSLAEIVLVGRDRAVRSAALDRLLSLEAPSQSALATIAIQDGDGALWARALPHIERRADLKDVARKAKRDDVRAGAQARLATLEAEVGKPSPERRRKERLKQLEPLAAQAARLAVTSDAVRAAQDIASLVASAAAIAGAYADLPEDDAARALRERISRAEATLAERLRALAAESAAAAERIALAEALLAEFTTLAPSTDAGVAAAQRWRALGQLPEQRRSALEARFAREFARLSSENSSEPSFAEPVASTRTWREPTAEESVELETISAAAEALIEAEDHRDASYRYKVLHKRWMMLSDGLHPDAPLRARFLNAYAAFKDRLRGQRESRNAVFAERETALEQLAVEAERLAQQPAAVVDRNARYTALKDLQSRARALGGGGDRIARLRTRLQAALDQAFAPLQELREAEDWERFQNLAKAEALTAEVAALASEERLDRVAQRVRDAHKRWKDVGQLPRDRQLAVWQAFKAACDAQYDRCKAYFAERDAARGVAEERKRALIAEAEALLAKPAIGLAGSPADVASKTTTAERLKAMQTEWKSAGPAPREVDEELWTSFRALCDRFFAGHHALREREQVVNLERKVALCVQAEQFAETAETIGGVSADRQRWLRQVKDLQAEWKVVGHVPMSDKEPVWTRFRAACDRVYALAKDELAAEEQERVRNLERKQELIAELEALAASGSSSLLREDAKAIQRKWREVGHVPREQFEQLNTRFRDLCDQIFQSPA